MTIQKKICLLGEFAVGKTSLVQRFVENIFKDKYLSTLGTKISRKTLLIEENNQSINLKFLIWDIAGAQKFNRITKDYYRGSSGAIVVCDLTRLETLTATQHYANDFLSINPQASLIFTGNKADLEDKILISKADLHKLAHEYQAPYFITSAKTGLHVETAFYTLGQTILNL